MNIRFAQEADLHSIQRVIETGFFDEEKKVIGDLTFDLLTKNTRPSIKSLVAEMENQVIGYVSYSPIFLKSDTNISGCIPAAPPLSPDHQKQGVGSKLVNRGIDMLTRDGVGVLLVNGDPGYYGRFGFKEEVGHSFVPPYPLEHPFGWAGMLLNKTAVPNSPIEFGCVTALSRSDLW